ncbi:Transmembrane 9 superfamily member 1 [Venturia inaequalis]|nr:Transmembrane 9 superfamily member 1 [Venturia inaequalis]
MPSSSDQSANSDTFPSSTPKTVSPHLSHNVYGELDPPWLIQVLEFPWRDDEYFEYSDRRGHDQKFDFLTWLVDRLDPKSRGALRRVHSRIKGIFPDASFFNVLRVTPRKTDPFKHLCKNDLRTIGKYCRELCILFDAVSSKETVASTENASRRLQEGHDDGEDWKRILLCLRDAKKITFRTTAKRPGHIVSSASINMLTEPFRQNFQYAGFLQNLTTLKLVPMHVPYITNLCSLGTDCKTEAWTEGKIWSQITELECQFYVQQEGGKYEVEWEKILQTLQRWLRGFKKNLRTLKFHWIVAKNTSGPRPHPLALEKWLPEKVEFAESPIVWNALRTLAVGNVQLHEDDADSELNLLDSRVLNVERYYRLKYATDWEILDFQFEGHESKYWAGYQRSANGRWKDPPGAERPRQIWSRNQSLHSQPKSSTRPSSERSSTYRTSNISRAGVNFAQDDIVGPLFLPQAANPTPLAPEGSPMHTSFKSSSTHHSGNTSRAGFNSPQEFSPKSPTSQHSSATGPPTQTEAYIRTRTNPRSTQQQGLEIQSPNLRAPTRLPDLQFAIEDVMDMYRPQQRLSPSSGGFRERSGESMPMSSRSGPLIRKNSKPLFVFEDDEEEEESQPQQQQNQINLGSKEDSGFSHAKSPISHRSGTSDRQAVGAIGTRTRSNLESRQLLSLDTLSETREDHSVDPESHGLQRQPIRNYGGWGNSPEMSQQAYQSPSNSQLYDSFVRPTYQVSDSRTRTHAQSIRRPDLEKTSRTHEDGRFLGERGLNSRSQLPPTSVTTFTSSVQQEPDSFDDVSRAAFGSRNPQLGSSIAESSVSSKYSTTQPTSFSLTQTRLEPLRGPTAGSYKDPRSQKETSGRTYEQGSYVTVIENSAGTDYDEFIGNPFANDDKSEVETLISSGPSNVHRGHVAALEADFRPPNLSAEEYSKPDSNQEQSRHILGDQNTQLTRPSRTRNFTPIETTQSLANIEDQVPKRRYGLDATEIVPARVGPLLPEEHVALFKRNATRPGLALVQPQFFGILTEDAPQEQLRNHFDHENPHITLENHLSAPEPQHIPRPHGKAKKGKRKHRSDPVENVRGDDVSVLSAREAERRSKDSILSGSYFPTKLNSPAESKKGFMKKMFKRRDSEESTMSKASKRDSKTSSGSEDGGKRRSFGRKMKDGVMDSVKTVRDGGKNWGNLIGGVTGLR